QLLLEVGAVVPDFRVELQDVTVRRRVHLFSVDFDFLQRRVHVDEPATSGDTERTPAGGGRQVVEVVRPVSVQPTRYFGESPEPVQVDVPLQERGLVHTDTAGRVERIN